MNRLDELQRQIEMAALIYEFPEKYSENDLASLFLTSESTIRRDVKALRDMGIRVFSRKQAYRVEMNLSEINSLVTTYLAFAKNETIKNLPLILEKFVNKTISFFVNTVKAIRDKHVMEIEYRSAKTDKLQWRTITPVAFYNAGKTHYLIAIHQDVPKMFTIERIGQFRFTKQPSPVKEIPSVNELFKDSWGSFTGGKIVKVRLRFSDDHEQYMSDKFWIENQETRHTDEGFEITLHVKLSNEFIAWVMGWGDAVEVLEPDELKTAIVKKANAITKKYN
ncbi:WYL domain-containing transcriptional regulator [bacterium]|nr:WYL domain-containing transcriptional regulator [bacterium]